MTTKFPLLLVGNATRGNKMAMNFRHNKQRANLRIIVAISSMNKPFFFQIKDEIIIGVILVKVLLRKDKFSWRELDRGHVERYFKSDTMLTRFSVLSYSATVHLGRPARVSAGKSVWLKQFTIVSS